MKIERLYTIGKQFLLVIGLSTNNTVDGTKFIGLCMKHLHAKI